MSCLAGRRRLTTVRAALVGIFLPMVLVASAGAQQVPTAQVKGPLVEHAEPMTQPGSMLELPDGRLLVADSKERIVMLYDFSKGTATQVSRQGGGPLEYQFPSGIFAVGDSIVVVDMLQQRLLVLDRNGTPLRTHRMIAAGADAVTSMLRVGVVLAVDTQGRFYTESRGMTVVQGKMPIVSDTVALVRWKVLGSQGDTLATRFEHTEMPKMSGKPSEGISMKLPILAMVQRDAWSVFGDGLVGVARAADYHTEWIDASGKRSVGPRVPYVPSPVTEADKARVRKTTREAYEMGLKLGASMAAGSGQKMPKLALEVEEPDAWPKVKPAFAGVRASPDGRLWVARTMPNAPEQAEYDVIAAGGKLERHVRFPKDVQLLGFGKGVIYAMRKDEDDLRYLQRYRMP